ncbi:hypothetical protein DOTSEDRAFT_19032 [Dothistroma septosporum NZE10]|uniref:Uncharacterized protein n=1 Tax=Dothistroma septosporum (strain NZE10 / CBS 128990) TaxID=675120 RepID=N1Q1I2_DOTSN|nr:hypothetical protein DOTSEDRAFT_19032 [Dothistroma septosporum NZE10]
MPWIEEVDVKIKISVDVWEQRLNDCSEDEAARVRYKIRQFITKLLKMLNELIVHAVGKEVRRRAADRTNRSSTVVYTDLHFEYHDKTRGAPMGMKAANKTPPILDMDLSAQSEKVTVETCSRMPSQREAKGRV